MVKCRICGKRGLFISNNGIGICKSCALESENSNNNKNDDVFFDSNDLSEDRFFYKYGLNIQEKLTKIICLTEKNKYDDALVALDELKKYCFNKGKAGESYFNREFMRGYLKRDASYYESILFQKQKHESQKEISKCIPIERPRIIQIIKSNPGILQKDMYAQYEASGKRSVVVAIIQALVKDDVIKKVKKGNSYQLYMKDKN